MGWICTPLADRTMAAIAAACQATREPHGDQCGNAFYANGKRYFYEITRRDQKDRGIAGVIHLCVGDDECRPVGRFRIAGNGAVVRGPALFKKAKPVKDGKSRS